MQCGTETVTGNTRKGENDMEWKRKKKEGGPVAVCQLRSGETHPFGALRGFTPLGTGEEQVYRQLREAVPVLDAAVGKLVRL